MGLKLGFSPRKWVSRFRRGSSDDVKLLNPIALAGASTKIIGNAATRIYSSNSAGNRKDSRFEDVNRVCKHCKQSFLRYASKYPNHCSVSCKNETP